MAAWVKEEEKVSEHRQRKREAYGSQSCLRSRLWSRETDSYVPARVSPCTFVFVCGYIKLVCFIHVHRSGVNYPPSSKIKK